MVVEVDQTMDALDTLRRRRTVRAEAGTNGGSSRKHGRSGRDTVVRVPLGTIIWKEVAGGEQRLKQLSMVGERVVIARGGKGGRGNARMATATRRRPGFAERGLAGESVRLRLESRLLVDVGLIGLSNAGKSSLLRAMTAARPKTGAYAFTTRTPHLGVAEQGYEQLVLADIPGLVKGATSGSGLGAGFLRHVEWTRVLLYVVDVSRPFPAADIEVVRREVATFGGGLEKKRWLVALNKIDLPGARERAEEVVSGLHLQGHRALLVSALTKEGVDSLLEALFDLAGEAKAVGQVGKTSTDDEEMKLWTQLAPFEVHRVGTVFHIVGARPQEAVGKLGVASAEAKVELVRRLRRMGVVGALRRAGITDGGRVRIGSVELEWPL